MAARSFDSSNASPRAGGTSRGRGEGEGGEEAPGVAQPVGLESLCSKSSEVEKAIVSPLKRCIQKAQTAGPVVSPVALH